MSIGDRLRALAASAGTKRIIEKDMTEEECRRAVKRISKAAIARRARALVAAGARPGTAIRQARREWKKQYGGFR